MKPKREPFLLKYFHDKVWNVRPEAHGKPMAFLIKQLRIIWIVSKNFTKDKLQVQSAGLTFYTMLSVVPLVALVFAIAKGFGLQATLEAEITKAFEGHEDVIAQVLIFATQLLENTKGGLLAGIGVVVLLWTVMQLLVNVETSFNEIWKVEQGRTLIRKLSEYFSIMLLAPIVIIIAGSITVVISVELENLVAGYDILRAIGPVIHFFVRMIPYTLIWLLFTFLYMVMPNTKVRFSSAFVAGVIAGTAFQLLEWGYIEFQVGVSRYNAIYGSFAALPLFMIWVNISWLITLIGAEIAFANQNVSQIENEIQDDKMSNSQQHAIALLLMKRIAVRFDQGGNPLTAKELSATLELPYGITARVLNLMVEARLLSELQTDGKEATAFLPLKSLEKLFVEDLIEALDHVGHSDIPHLQASAFEQYYNTYCSWRNEVHGAQRKQLVRELPDVKITKGE